MTDKAQAFEVLLDEISTALSDAVEAMKAGQQGQDEICSGLADILELLKARGERNDVGALTEAIRGLKLTAPEVQVTVQPAAVQVIERAPQAYRMQAKYDDHDRLVDLIVFPTERPAEQPKLAGPRVIWPGQ